MSLPSPQRAARVALATAAGLLLAGCAQMQMGSPDAKTTATGSAAGSTTENASSQLEKCASSLGTVAVYEDTNAPWYGILTGQMKLGSTSPVLKLLIQQSNCFVVVDRGRAMNNMMQERALNQMGELRQGSKFGKGQMVSADYTMSPTITFSNNNAGGMGGGLGGLSRGAGVLGAVVGAVNVKEASTLLTLVDNRSGVQLAAAEGSARNMDFGAMGALFGSGFGAGGGGYTNTAEGKVIVAAFTDSYNNLVRAVRNYKAQEVKGGLGTGGNLGVQGAQEAQGGKGKRTR
ncbi:MAG: Curli production assembly/transport component CsgG [Candidatus Accumulibacter adjunctus]|uniref:Curli production assembly/transport component CsgG n=1 Tax=Candidatus Accumulibacter adjunctus TaxID=1454001 RepID=A0A011MBT3_9PROT|nr:MAG: Curli production assembly/transport component CsgG [Candidatus Accumulibacter adjunctus]